MSEDILNKLTIVIISYNRQKYLKRIIKFWSNYKVNILIIDGSLNKLEDDYINHKNLTYIHSQKSLYERYLNSVDFIKTEFVILACDDEFYLPSALRSCINFLLSNPSYSSCGGRAIGFRTKEKKIFGIRQYSKLKDFDLIDNNAKVRAHTHFSAYVPAHFYSVITTNIWKIVISNVLKKKFNFFASFELQVEFLITISGKSKIISELMWLRNNEEPKININSDPKIDIWWNNRKFEKEKEIFLYNMKKIVNKLDLNQESKLDEHTIKNIFETYVQKINQNTKKTYLRKISKLIPYEIKQLIKFIKKWYHIKSYRYRPIVNEKNFSEEIKVLEKEKTFINQEELNKITSILIEQK